MVLTQNESKRRNIAYQKSEKTELALGLFYGFFLEVAQLATAKSSSVMTPVTGYAHMANDGVIPPMMRYTVTTNATLIANKIAPIAHPSQEQKTNLYISIHQKKTN